MLIKLDLHLHSYVSRSNGDGIKWDSLYHSISKLLINKVKIASFSDHNKFDLDFYLEAKKLAQTAGILLLPAIEVNVVRTDGKIANIIYVFSNELSNDQLKEISLISKTQLPKRGISLKKCNHVFEQFNPIMIPHVGKSDHFKYEDLIQVKFDAMEISNDKDKNYLSVIKKGISSSIVAFSDTHKWNDYPQLRKLFTYIDMENISFDELQKQLKKSKNYTKGIDND